MLVFRSAALFFDSGVFLITFNPLVRSSVSERMDLLVVWVLSVFFFLSINLDLIRFDSERIQLFIMSFNLSFFWTLVGLIPSYNAQASEAVELSTNVWISCLVRGDDDDIRFNPRADQNTVDVLRSAGCCRASRAQDARRVRLVRDVGCFWEGLLHVGTNLLLDLVASRLNTTGSSVIITLSRRPSVLQQ